MCGGAPRGMAFKDRGMGNVPLWSIRVNVPKHARYLEFGFTDGYNWDEGFKVKVKEYPGFEGNDDSFFTKVRISISLSLSSANISGGKSLLSELPNPTPRFGVVPWDA
jgi:hypothetical protein